MKATVFDISGKEKGTVDLPSVFNTAVRADLAQKYYEVFVYEGRTWHSPFDEAGRQSSASGTISHRRHEWKGHYGKGIARVPRKAMWRRGTQFYWIGAEVSGTRGGRSVHAATGVRTPLKMNRKESILAFNSALAATASSNLITKRYASIEKISAPFVIESLPKKTKELFAVLKSVFGSAFSVVLQKKNVRAGAGKARNRRYKSSAGLLIVTGATESVKFSGVDIKPANQLEITDVYPLGRLTLYTKKALEELGGKK